MRWIVRVYAAGGRTAHCGAFSDVERAKSKARLVAARARKRGLNVSVTVRELESGGIGADALLELLAPGAEFHAPSYGGQNERGGDLADAGVTDHSRRASIDEHAGAVAESMLASAVGRASLEVGP